MASGPVSDVGGDPFAARAQNVTYDVGLATVGPVSLVHRPILPERTLDDLRDEIYRVTDRWALEIGHLLHQAKQICPKRHWKAWCDTEIPFGHDKADRLIAIWRAYDGLPEHVLKGLPRPWQAQFALKSVPRDRLEAGIASGEVNPMMTIVQARAWAQVADVSGQIPKSRYSPVDLLAGKLLNQDPADLHPKVADELLKWLNSRPIDV